MPSHSAPNVEKIKEPAKEVKEKTSNIKEIFLLSFSFSLCMNGALMDILNSIKKKYAF